ncbi:FAD-dependent oxidoreductase, partial [Devosia chinhatensis]
MLGLSTRLECLGLQLGRLKTVTPARLNVNTINYSVLEEQPGDDPPEPFPALDRAVNTPHVSSPITRTIAETHILLVDT